MASVTIWRDDFELISPGSFNGGVKSSNWSCQEGDGTDYGIPGWGNGEWQAYQSGPDAVRVQPDPSDPSKGQLVITAIKHPHPVPCPNKKGLPPSHKTYTSARINTKGKQQFGWNMLPNPNQSLFVEARIKLPAPGNGLWPAFWMLPADPCPGWPEGGEIDIMEASNQFNVTTSALHFKAANGHHAFIPGGENTAYVNKDHFHVFGVEWNRTKIRFYVDTTTIHEVAVNAWNGFNKAKGDPDGPFNKPFYIILNLAVGGGYPGVKPEQCTWEQAEMVVDWVHVFTRGTLPGPAPDMGPWGQPGYEVVAFRLTQHNPDSSSMVSESYFPDPALESMFVKYVPEPYKIVLAMEGRTFVPQLPPDQQFVGYARLWALLAPVGAHSHKRMVGGRTDISGVGQEGGNTQVQWGEGMGAEVQEHQVATFLGPDRLLRKVKAYFKLPSAGRPACAVTAYTSSNGQLNNKVSDTPTSGVVQTVWGPGVVCWNNAAGADVPCDFVLNWANTQPRA